MQKLIVKREVDSWFESKKAKDIPTRSDIYGQISLTVFFVAAHVRGYILRESAKPIEVVGASFYPQRIVMCNLQ